MKLEATNLTKIITTQQNRVTCICSYETNTTKFIIFYSIFTYEKYQKGCLIGLEIIYYNIIKIESHTIFLTNHSYIRQIIKKYDRTLFKHNILKLLLFI